MTPKRDEGGPPELAAPKAKLMVYLDQDLATWATQEAWRQGMDRSQFIGYLLQCKRVELGGQALKSDLLTDLKPATMKVADVFDDAGLKDDPPPGD